MKAPDAPGEWFVNRRIASAQQPLPKSRLIVETERDVLRRCEIEQNKKGEPRESGSPVISEWKSAGISRRSVNIHRVNSAVLLRSGTSRKRALSA